MDIPCLSSQSESVKMDIFSFGVYDKIMLNKHHLAETLHMELSQLKEEVSSLEEEKDHMEDDLDAREAELSEQKKKYKRLENEHKSLLLTTGEDKELQSKLEAVMDQKRLLEKRLAQGRSDDGKMEDYQATIVNLESTVVSHKSTIAALKSEISLLHEKLEGETRKRKESAEKVNAGKKVRPCRYLNSDPDASLLFLFAVWLSSKSETNKPNWPSPV